MSDFRLFNFRQTLVGHGAVFFTLHTIIRTQIDIRILDVLTLKSSCQHLRRKLILALILAGLTVTIASIRFGLFRMSTHSLNFVTFTEMRIVPCETVFAIRNVKEHFEQFIVFLLILYLITVNWLTNKLLMNVIHIIVQPSWQLITLL